MRRAATSWSSSQWWRFDEDIAASVNRHHWLRSHNISSVPTALCDKWASQKPQSSPSCRQEDTQCAKLHVRSFLFPVSGVLLNFLICLTTNVVDNVVVFPQHFVHHVTDSYVQTSFGFSLNRAKGEFYKENFETNQT